MYSDEWYLIKPSSDTIVGDMLVIEGHTDIDNIIVSWMDGFKVNSGEAKQSIGSTQPNAGKVAKMVSYMVKEDKDSENGYNYTIANAIVPNNIKTLDQDATNQQTKQTDSTVKNTTEQNKKTARIVKPQ